MLPLICFMVMTKLQSKTEGDVGETSHCVLLIKFENLLKLHLFLNSLTYQFIHLGCVFKVNLKSIRTCFLLSLLLSRDWMVCWIKGVW